MSYKPGTFRAHAALALLLTLLFTLPLAPAAAQRGETPFDPSMTLEQTVKWVGRQLTHTRRLMTDSGYTRRYETSLVRARGCELSYWKTNEAERAETAVTSLGMRELWKLDLSGLDPARVRALPAGRGYEATVRFNSDGTTRDAIRVITYHGDSIISTRSNAKYGQFSVRDEKALDEVAAGLRHAVVLCRQGRR